MRVEMPRKPDVDSFPLVAVGGVGGFIVGLTLSVAGSSLLGARGLGCGPFLVCGLILGVAGGYLAWKKVSVANYLALAEYDLLLEEFSKVNNDNTPLEVLEPIVRRYERKGGMKELIARIKTHPNWK